MPQDPSPAPTPRPDRYDLGAMSLGRLTAVYFSYPAVLIYLALAAAALGGAFRLGLAGEPVRGATAAFAAVLLYPLVWYGLHRFVLHGRWLYRSPLTAALWKRVHYDHHNRPQSMDVLFGALFTTLPTIALVSGPVGWALGGAPAALAAFAAGVLTTCVYEFCHCVQHLNYSPRLGWLRDIKRAHMDHHFHDESGNYGIISFWPDRLLGTYYADRRQRTRSPTVFNLGYEGEEAKRFPWVAARTEGARGARRAA